MLKIRLGNYIDDIHYIRVAENPQYPILDGIIKSFDCKLHDMSSCPYDFSDTEQFPTFREMLQAICELQFTGFSYIIDLLQNGDDMNVDFTPLINCLNNLFISNNTNITGETKNLAIVHILELLTRYCGKTSLVTPDIGEPYLVTSGINDKLETTNVIDNSKMSITDVINTNPQIIQIDR